MSIQSDEEKRDALRTRLAAAEAREAALVSAAKAVLGINALDFDQHEDDCPAGGDDPPAGAVCECAVAPVQRLYDLVHTASRPHAEAHDERMREEGRQESAAAHYDAEANIRTALSERTAEVERLRAENESARVATLRMLHEWVDNNHVGRDDDDNDIAKDIRTEIGNMILEATMPPDAEP